MIDEEKQLENTQNPPADAPVGAAGETSQSASAIRDANALLEAEMQAASGGYSEMYVEAVDSGVRGSQEATGKEKASQLEDSGALAALMQANQSLTGQIDDLKNQYARLAADFDNFRKRTQKEKDDLSDQIKCATLKELLPVVDNFERARSHIKPQSETEMNIHKSYQGVYKQMVDCLKRIGVAPMRPEGQEFDPNLHEAVMRQQTDEYPEGTVIEELVRGYLLGDRVLRHAMVKVAAAVEPVIPSEESNPDQSQE